MYWFKMELNLQSMGGPRYLMTKSGRCFLYPGSTVVVSILKWTSVASSVLPLFVDVWYLDVLNCVLLCPLRFLQLFSLNIHRISNSFCQDQTGSFFNRRSFKVVVTVIPFSLQRQLPDRVTGLANIKHECFETVFYFEWNTLGSKVFHFMYM